MITEEYERERENARRQHGCTKVEGGQYIYRLPTSLLFQFLGGKGLDMRQLTKIWCPTNVVSVEWIFSALGDADWSPKPFNCLKIRSEIKTLLLSFAKTF